MNRNMTYVLMLIVAGIAARSINASTIDPHSPRSFQNPFEGASDAPIQSVDVRPMIPLVVRLYESSRQYSEEILNRHIANIIASGNTARVTPEYLERLRREVAFQTPEYALGLAGHNTSFDEWTVIERFPYFLLGRHGLPATFRDRLVECYQDRYLAAHPEPRSMIMPTVAQIMRRIT